MPYEPTPTCHKCNRKVSKQKALQCNICKFYFHSICATLSDNICHTCSKNNRKCTDNNDNDQNLQSNHLSNNNKSSGKINNCSVKNFNEFYNTCNSFQMPFDDDDHPIHIECKYYDTISFNKINGLNDHKFGILHLNIASLNKHFDDLCNLLATIEFSFPVIGLSEHKIGKHSPINNINLPGYQFCYNSTNSTHGGTGFYISNNLSFQKRDDLIISKDFELESTFIEINLQKNDNIIIGCIYRHPNMSITEFNEKFLPLLLDKITLENKTCFLLGDFNINLLNVNSNNQISNFYNGLTSFHSSYTSTNKNK